LRQVVETGAEHVRGEARSYGHSVASMPRT
jgi:hypothetical protein